MSGSDASVAASLEPGLEEALIRVYQAMESNQDNIMSHPCARGIRELLLGLGDDAGNRTETVIPNHLSPESDLRQDVSNGAFDRLIEKNIASSSVVDSEAGFVPSSASSLALQTAAVVRDIVQAESLNLAYLPCQVCSLTFENHDALLKHIVNKHAPSLLGQVNIERDRDSICQYCHKLLEDVHFSEHLCLHHPYTCRSCSLAFISQAEKTLHDMKEHQAHFVCPFCQKSFKKRVGLEGHQKAMGHTVTCFWCTKECFTETGLEQHQRSKHPRASRLAASDCAAACPWCTREFLNETDLEQHALAKHPRASRRRA